MRIIKTASFIALAAARINFPWKQSLTAALQDGLTPLGHQVAEEQSVDFGVNQQAVDEAQSDYERQEAAHAKKEQWNQTIMEIVERWMVDAVPKDLKTFDGALLPEFSEQVRDFVIHLYGVDPFPAYEPEVADYNPEDLERQWNQQ